MKYIFTFHIIKQHYSFMKRRLATTLQRENALFILNTSANILYASNRYTPNQDTYIEDVLNESVHCS